MMIALFACYDGASNVKESSSGALNVGLRKSFLEPFSDTSEKA